MLSATQIAVISLASVQTGFMMAGMLGLVYYRNGPVISKMAPWITFIEVFCQCFISNYTAQNVVQRATIGFVYLWIFWIAWVLAGCLIAKAVLIFGKTARARLREAYENERKEYSGNSKDSRSSLNAEKKEKATPRALWGYVRPKNYPAWPLFYRLHLRYYRKPYLTNPGYINAIAVVIAIIGAILTGAINIGITQYREHPGDPAEDRTTPELAMIVVILIVFAFTCIGTLISVWGRSDCVGLRRQFSAMTIGYVFGIISWVVGTLIVNATNGADWAEAINGLTQTFIFFPPFCAEVLYPLWLEHSIRKNVLSHIERIRLREKETESAASSAAEDDEYDESAEHSSDEFDVLSLRNILDFWNPLEREKRLEALHAEGFWKWMFPFTSRFSGWRAATYYTRSNMEWQYREWAGYGSLLDFLSVSEDVKNAPAGSILLHTDTAIRIVTFAWEYLRTKYDFTEEEQRHVISPRMIKKMRRRFSLKFKGLSKSQRSAVMQRMSSTAVKMWNTYFIRGDPSAGALDEGAPLYIPIGEDNYSALEKALKDAMTVENSTETPDSVYETPVRCLDSICTELLERVEDVYGPSFRESLEFNRFLKTYASISGYKTRDVDISLSA